MQNPKTTISGYVAIGLSLATFGYKLYSGSAGAEDIGLLLSLLSGLGLVQAKDGGR